MLASIRVHECICIVSTYVLLCLYTDSSGLSTRTQEHSTPTVRLCILSGLGTEGFGGGHFVWAVHPGALSGHCHEAPRRCV